MADNRIYLACNDHAEKFLLFSKLGHWRSAYDYYPRDFLDNFLEEHQGCDITIHTEVLSEPEIYLTEKAEERVKAGIQVMYDGSKVLNIT